MLGMDFHAVRDRIGAAHLAMSLGILDDEQIHLGIGLWPLGSGSLVLSCEATGA